LFSFIHLLRFSFRRLLFLYLKKLHLQKLKKKGDLEKSSYHFNSDIKNERRVLCNLYGTSAQQMLQKFFRLTRWRKRHAKKKKLWTNFFDAAEHLWVTITRRRSCGENRNISCLTYIKSRFSKVPDNLLQIQKGWNKNWIANWTQKSTQEEGKPVFYHHWKNHLYSLDLKALLVVVVLRHSLSPQLAALKKMHLQKWKKKAIWKKFLSL